MVEFAASQPIENLSSIAQSLWTATSTDRTGGAEQVAALLTQAYDYFTSSPTLEQDETNTFLQTAAYLIYGYSKDKAVVSTCVRACGMLFVRDPWYEYKKKRIILEQFATLIDLVHISRVTVNHYHRTRNKHATARVMANLSYLLKIQIASVAVPSLYQEALDYLAGTMEYFAFLPHEIEQTIDDFLPEVFIAELERKLSYYPRLHIRPAIAA